MNPTEDEIIRFFAGRAEPSSASVMIGIGDDMAQVRMGRGSSVLITTDMLLAGVHFDISRATLDQIGYKAVCVSLSDCAAMAVRPMAVVAAVAIPVSFGDVELKQLHGGLTRATAAFGCSLVGGDITRWKRSGSLALCTTALGRPVVGKPVMRSGARPGDRICVTGALGGSRRSRHLEFTPRVAEAVNIACKVPVHAMIDISDGLSTDLTRLCRHSGVGAVVEAEAIPVSADASDTRDPISAALNDGEDFELLFTLSSRSCAKLLARWTEPTPITEIGRITDTGKIRLRRSGGVYDLPAGGYDHMSR